MLSQRQNETNGLRRRKSKIIFNKRTTQKGRQAEGCGKPGRMINIAKNIHC